ncbi:hypothetical protein [Methanopyrus sp.]
MVEGAEALERAAHTLRDVRGPLSRYCRYLLYRGRVAEVAGLLNEVHALAYAVAKLAESIGGRLGHPPEVEEALVELLDASREELECKVLRPCGLREAREREREALERLKEALKGHGEVDKAEAVEEYLDEIRKKDKDYVWTGPRGVNKLRKALGASRIPFRRGLRRALEGVMKDETVRELLEVSRVGYDDPAKVAEDPPVRRIRNKLMHADPVLEGSEEHADLTELLRVHLESITLKVLGAWARAIEGKLKAVGERRPDG